MVRIQITMTAEDVGEAAMLLQELIANQINDGYVEGLLRKKELNYRYDVQEYNNG